MRSLETLTSAEARAIDTFVFDLDDTFLDHGKMSERAYASLFELRRSGLALVACTGRPSGWAEVMARQWPLDAAIAENGAVAWVPEGERVRLVDGCSSDERASRRRKIADIVERLLAELPELALADDNGARVTDTTFDIGEHRRVDAATVARARALAQGLGARTFVSSVHLHVTLDGHDKASGYLQWARLARGRDAVTALARAAFVGDSSNDAAAFAAFGHHGGLTFGVANVRAFLRALTVRPTFVASLPMGEGFAEIVAAVCRARAAT